MKRRVLVTGGSGLLGVNWALARRESWLVTLALHSRRIVVPGVEVREISLENDDDLLRALEELRPDLVVHTTALTSVEACEADPAMARHINVDLAANVARACARASVSLVHISTDHLFAGDTPWMTEADPVAPVNMYARTKADAERAVLEAHPSALVARTNFYSWGPSYRRSFSDTILAALRERRPVTLFEDVEFTPLLADVLIETVEELVARGASAIFNVVGDERLSKHEFGLRIARHFELDPGVIRAGRLADQTTLVARPREMSLCNARARSVLGRPLGNVDEHLRRLRQQEAQGRAREVQQL